MYGTKQIKGLYEHATSVLGRDTAREKYFAHKSIPLLLTFLAPKPKFLEHLLSLRNRKIEAGLGYCAGEGDVVHTSGAAMPVPLANETTKA